MEQLPPHGDRKRYIHRTYPCRCDECKEANNNYMHEYRIRRRNNGGRPLNTNISLTMTYAGKARTTRAKIGPNWGFSDEHSR